LKVDRVSLESLAKLKLRALVTWSRFFLIFPFVFETGVESGDPAGVL
jgi:hypothetical protein